VGVLLFSFVGLLQFVFYLLLVYWYLLFVYFYSFVFYAFIISSRYCFYCPFIICLFMMMMYGFMSSDCFFSYLRSIYSSQFMHLIIIFVYMSLLFYWILCLYMIIFSSVFCIIYLRHQHACLLTTLIRTTLCCKHLACLRHTVVLQRQRREVDPGYLQAQSAR